MTKGKGGIEASASVRDRPVPTSRDCAAFARTLKRLRSSRGCAGPPPAGYLLFSAHFIEHLLDSLFQHCRDSFVNDFFIRLI